MLRYPKQNTKNQVSVTNLPKQLWTNVVPVDFRRLGAEYIEGGRNSLCHECRITTEYMPQGLNAISILITPGAVDRTLGTSVSITQWALADQMLERIVYATCRNQGTCVDTMLVVHASPPET